MVNIIYMHVYTYLGCTIHAIFPVMRTLHQFTSTVGAFQTEWVS